MVGAAPLGVAKEEVMSDTLELGARVVKLTAELQRYNPDEDELWRGTIEAISRKHGKVFVKWDSSWRKPNPEEVELLCLISEDEADKKMSILEKDYAVWAGAAREKCEAAAELIAEANEITKAHGQALGEMYDINHVIKSAMGGAGWRTSSWNC
jgi:hypothetical protein